MSLVPLGIVVQHTDNLRSLQPSPRRVYSQFYFPIKYNLVRLLSHTSSHRSSDDDKVKQQKSDSLGQVILAPPPLSHPSISKPTIVPVNVEPITEARILTSLSVRRRLSHLLVLTASSVLLGFATNFSC